MRILTFDIEEWFHILDHPATKTTQSWSQYPSRLKEGVETILSMLLESNQKATFFCLGWVAEKHPDVIRAIDNSGFHIGTHSYAHQLAYEQNRQDFQEDLKRSIGVLQDTIGKSINCYRAPGFSITAENLWAFEVLLEEGIKIDCSLFPANRAHGGLPNLQMACPAVGFWGSDEIRLFPINTKSILGKNIIFSGGGYFRLIPNHLIQEWFSNTPYIMTYFHPRDFDAEQPIIPGLSLARRFKSYVGIKGAKSKLVSLLSTYEFMDVRDAVQSVDWNLAPRIDLESGTIV